MDTPAIRPREPRLPAWQLRAARLPPRAEEGAEPSWPGGDPVTPRRFPRQPGLLAMGGRMLRLVPLAGGVLGLLALVHHLGTGSIASALAQISWGPFVVICLVYGLSVTVDTLAWRYTLAADPPPFHRLLAAKFAGEAVNVVTALGSAGGEATKAWLLRRDTPYAASVPSLILAKTTLVLAQALLLAVGIVIAATTGIGGPALLVTMGYLLLAEVLGIGGFLVVQISGVVGRAGRLLAWAGAKGSHHAQQLDEALRSFYRDRWQSLLLSVGFHFAGWMIGTLEAVLILKSLGLSVSLMVATVIDAMGSGVRFATFFVPASLGALEGSNAAAFTAFGWAASAGVAFTLVRRARQAIWIGVGLVILLAMGSPGSLVTRRVGHGQSGGA